MTRRFWQSGQQHQAAGSIRALERIAGVLFVLWQTACGGLPARNDDLFDNVRGYAEGVRWRRYEDAAARIPPKNREKFLDERESLDDDLSIDDYQITRIKVSDRRAMVQVEYTWHLDSSGVVRETTVEQTWELDRNQWMLVSEARKHGIEMPGLPEPPDTDKEGSSLESVGDQR
ncbi:MAG: hypothetical protein V2A73_20600 [Pseudomonadota bacterium]